MGFIVILSCYYKSLRLTLLEWSDNVNGLDNVYCFLISLFIKNHKQGVHNSR